ncbi:MAG: VTT domain-containing protein [Chloroflexota bacterium]|nr:MAG: VTT domain-containing protein [Chloroflexota bacterium]
MDLFYSPLAWAVVLVLALIGTAGSVPTYYLGQKGMPAVREKYPQVPEERLQQVQGWFERWGALILLLTVLPGFGTIIPPVAGANGVRFPFFILMIFLAKLIRFWFLALVIFGSARALRNWLQS